MPRVYIWIAALLLLLTVGATDAIAATLRLGHDHPNTSPYHKGALRFAELVRAKTNGKLNIDIYGEAMITTEPGLATHISRGSLDMAVITVGNLTRFNPDFLIFELPYLFESYAHADRVLRGPVGKELADKLETRGLKVLSFWESGFRHFANNVHPVREPEDLMQLTIATPHWMGAIETADANGGISRPMPTTHFYDALKNKEVDGLEGPVFSMRAFHFYEFLKYLTLDGHTYMPAALIINPRRLQNMPREFRTAIVEAAEEAGVYQRRTVRDQVEDDVRFLEDIGGMEIITVADKSPWIEASRRVYDTLSPRINAKLLGRVRSLAPSLEPKSEIETAAEN